MSLENWMDTRKLVLLKEKKEKLFNSLPQSPDFHAARAELYKILSRIETEKRFSSPHSSANEMGVPMVA